ncbi:type IV secretory pathway VirB10-like protein [Streptomyces sp. SAI-117]|uniref:DNA primase n=1 Tax=unclassified Streptomyces TaxID=2593676 RepID=UPI0024753263|nr:MULTISPECIES: DNA primase [unclassified Streptomyces]MDH6547669.1 type IV secretory pathway VirB10-like protein [Streptomyces sp. SAI-041]MDH6566755.1 type IV secretory pathway VirB10-like protein [Streptomyces sp. SAI-117]
MNRVGLGLAVGAGYVLGRTKKLKLAFAVGSVVAGKKMHLSPRAVADLVSQQLLKNPQFKEIGDTLREDLRGVGKAASGAMVERQIDAIADRLHGRTAQVRDQLSGVAPEVPGLSDDEDDEPERDEESEEETGTEAEAEADEEPSDEHDDEAEDDGEQDEAPAAAKKTAEKAPAKKTAAKKQPGRKPPAKKTAQSQGRTAGKKTAAKKTTAKKAAAKKTTAARGAGRSTRSRLPKGGGE